MNALIFIAKMFLVTAPNPGPCYKAIESIARGQNFQVFIYSQKSLVFKERKPGVDRAELEAVSTCLTTHYIVSAEKPVTSPSEVCETNKKRTLCESPTGPLEADMIVEIDGVKL